MSTWDEVHDRVKWWVNDAAFKAPEQLTPHYYECMANDVANTATGEHRQPAVSQRLDPPRIMRAGRFVLCSPMESSEPAYVTSWDTWEECRAAFENGRMPAGFELHDDETGRVWHPGARYVWEDAQT